MDKHQQWVESNLKLMREFNKPHMGTVAVNTTHIGDDNDYSVKLSQWVRALYAINPEYAYQLFLTDPMLVNHDLTADEFVEMMDKNKYSKGGIIGWLNEPI